MKNNEVDVDFVSSCTEEVALEGLDGITLSGLWVRLVNRSKFPLAIDEPCKRWLWKLIVSRGSIEFFELPQPRGALVVYNRFEFVDPDTGFITEPDTIQDDVYPIGIVKGADVQGSCAAFETRVNVTAEIRDESMKPKMTLSEAEEKWGEKLVLVCSQEERRKALTGLRVDPLLSMPDILYCVLERIGRSRFMGEVTSGKLSMSCVCDPKTLFYMRKKLWKMNLITQQVFHHRVGTTRFKKCVLLHLTRFSSRRKSTLSVMLGQVYSILNSKPDRMETTKVVFSQLGLKDDAVKKFVKSHLGCLAEVTMRPVREVFPGLPEEECIYGGSGNERHVKMIHLLDHVTESNLDEKVSASENRHFDDEDDSQEESAFTMSSSTGMVDTSRQYIDKPLMRQGFELIEKCGSKGLTIREFAARIGLRSMDCRLLVNGLVASKMVVKVPLEIGKQRAFRLVAQWYCGKAHDDLVYECRRFLRIANIDVDTKSAVSISKDGLLKDVVAVCQQTRPSTHGTLNLRMMKRACRILEMIKSAKVVESTTSFRTAIVEDEVNEGVGSIDKKTVLRMLYFMISDRLIKSFNTTLKLGTTEKKITMFCDPSVSVKDEVFQNALQIAKFRRFAVCTTEAKAQVKKRVDLKKESIKMKMEYVPRIGYTYGYEPKLLRMKTIHKFFCFLACDYDGDCAKVSDEEREAIELQVTDGFAVPTIYNGKLSWKTFIPPLPDHKDWPHRWILLSDVLLRLPLSIFVKIINVTFNINGLMEYLDHPVKKHFLVSQIPTDVRNMLLFARKYIYNAHELATKLGYMGLVSFSPNQQKEKDQVFLYLHRNIVLKDTKTSKPGYMTVSTDKPFEALSFTLDTLEDADVFWQALEDICVKTPLGSWNAALGQSVTVELPHKKACLVECSRPKMVDQIVDDGHVPGDGFGAGGLDSSLFSHLRRNWRWINVIMSREKTDGEKKPAKAKLDAGEEAGPNSQKRLARLSDKRRTLTVQRQEKTSDTGMETAAAAGEVSASVAARKRKASTEPKHARKAKKPKVRTVKARRVRRVRRPFHDEKDKAALERMRNLRVTWTDQEDSFLLLCKVASILLDPASRTMFVLSSVVRDLLYRNCPQLSMNKTSHACQRRIRYMMLNSDTVYNVSVFVGEAKQDQEIIELCGAPRPNRNNDEGCRVAFTLVLNKLLDKFKLRASGLSTAMELPRTMDELEAKYSLVLSDNFISTDSRHHDVKNVVDIRCSIAYTLLIGALGVGKDKNNWSYHLYRILQQYPDNLLRSVFAVLRADALVSATKKTTRAIKGFSLASIPYQLSQKFHRIFTTLVSEGIYTEASCLLGQLLEDARAGCPDSLGVPIHNDSEGGFATVFQSCVATRRITSNIYVADQVLVFDEESFKKSHHSHQEWSAGYQHWQAVSQDEKRDDDVSAGPCVGTLRMAPPSKASRTSRFALYMLRQQMTSSHFTKHNMTEYLSVELCPVHCRVKKPSAPFVVPKGLVDRFETRISVVIPAEIASFEEFLLLMEDPREVAQTRSLYDKILQHKELGIKELDLEGNSCGEEYEALHHRLEHLVEGHQVIRVGVTVPRYVAMVHGRPWILETVRTSKEEKAEALDKAPSLLSIATVSTPPDEKTAEESAEPLPLRPRRNSIRGKNQNDRKDVGQTDRKVVRLVYRPWRKPDGTVNRPLLNQMLRGVAGQVMFNPGISLEDLCAKFLPALQQVQVMELVDMLVEVGCFHRIFLKAPPIVSAFSRPNAINITETRSGAYDVTYLEADVECIPKLAQLLRLHSWSKTSCKSQCDPDTSAEP